MREETFNSWKTDSISAGQKQGKDEKMENQSLQKSEETEPGTPR